MSDLFRFSRAVPRDAAVEAWLKAQPGELGHVARHWFQVMRDSGLDARELMHDGHPTACVGDAAFAYIAVYAAHVNVGFFRGADLADPSGLLEGSGRLMRHVKLRPGHRVNETALAALIDAAYADMQQRLEDGPE